jgi:hypothetical protein
MSGQQQLGLGLHYEGRGYSAVGVAIDQARRVVINDDGTKRNLDHIFVCYHNELLTLPAPERHAGCGHRGDYTTETVDTDQHTVTNCADCGEQVEL